MISDKINKKQVVDGQWFIVGLYCTAILLTVGCSATPTVSNLPQANTNVQSAKNAPTAPPQTSPTISPRSPGGDAIDTSKFDAEIKQAEKALKSKPQDAEARSALANAYFVRATALTDARQYRAALGDYRRTLKYDSQHKDALNMSETIIGILKTMKRDIPAEGQEPPPLPFNKDGQTPEADSQKKSY